MKIAFVGYKENPVEIFKELAKELSKKISGLELEERFVPSLDDLPIVAFESSKDSDFIFVFAVGEKSELKLVEEKLIDVELQSQTRILKALEEDDFSGLVEEEYYMEKDKLVEKYVEIIVGILFNESEFEPKDKDFSI
jgi:hypothetical protein